MSMDLMQPQWSGISKMSTPAPTLALIFDPLIGISGVYRPIKPGDFRVGSGSSVQVVAANTTGTFQCQSFTATKAIWINQRSPMYRVYKTNESGNTAYLNWIPVNSGGWNNRVEIEGITNLSDLSIQTDSTSTTSVSGVVLCLF